MGKEANDGKQYAFRRTLPLVSINPINHKNGCGKLLYTFRPFILKKAVLRAYPRPQVPDRAFAPTANSRTDGFLLFPIGRTGVIIPQYKVV